MRKETLEAKLEQQQQKNSQITSLGATLWELSLTFSMVSTVVSMLLENPFLVVNFTS